MRCFSVLSVVVVCAAAVGQETMPAATKTPQWQRLLQGEDARQAATLEKQVQELDSKDDYAAAIQAAEELLALRTKAQGADHYETVTARQNIAALRRVAALDEEKRREWRSALLTQGEAGALREKGNHAAALLIERKVLAWRREILGEDHPDTASSYNSVAYHLNALRRTAEAQPLFQKALEICLRALGEDHPNTAGSYNNVAYNLRVQGKFVEAEPLYQQALEIYRRVLGEEHLDTARSYDNAAANLNAQVKSAQARPLLEKALEIRRRMQGEDHPDTATSYNFLALNLLSLGKYAEALLPSQKALEIYRRVLGEDHSYTAMSYNNVAASLDGQGKSAEAQPLYQKSLEICRRVLGEDDPETVRSYSNVAFNLNAQGKFADAQPLLQKALEVDRRMWGENHPDVASSYNSLAANLSDQGKPAEAQPLYQRALKICLLLLGENHPHTASSYGNLAGSLDAQGKLAEAQPLHEKALEIRRRVLRENHPDTATGYNSLASNLNAQGKSAEAEQLYQQALQIRLRVLGEDHRSTAASYNSLAHHLLSLGKCAEAEPLYEKSLAIRRRVLGEGHPETAITYNNLAIALHSQKKVAEAESFLRRAVFAFEASRLAGASGLDRASLAKFNPRQLLAVIQQSREPLQAWNEIELSLARGLLDQQAKGTRSLNPDEEGEWTRQRARVTDMQSEVLALVTKRTRSDEETAKLAGLVSDRQQFEEHLAALAVTASTREVSSPDAIRSALALEAAILFWVDVADKSGHVQEHWGCVVRPQGEPHWERLPGTGPDKAWTKADTELPQTFRNALAGHGSLAEIQDLAKALAAQRLAPLAPHLAGVKTVYAVPVDVMAGVPLEVLTDEHTISYVPSGTFLARLKDRPKPAGNRMLALGDPVYQKKAEAPRPTESPLPENGLLIVQVVPGGVAAQVKLEPGDVLVRYGDVALNSLEELSKAIQASASEKSVPLSVWRNGEEKPLVREVPPGKLGVMLSKEPAREAIVSRRQADSLLLALRGGNWNDLPGTRVELAGLAQLFGDGTTALLDSAASEQSLEDLRQRGELSRYRYLHFATHGAGNNAKAFESALILSQDALPDELMPRAGEVFLNGQLSAREVLDFWKLDADLVTLSACETAVGKKGGGDGMLGFAQAFLTAGSRSVCLSLWKVDDAATALLMNRFYQNLLGKRAGLEGPLPKAAALAEAKRWLRELSADEAKSLASTSTRGISRGERGKGEELKLLVPAPIAGDAPPKDAKPFADPRFWAAFVLIGDPGFDPKP